MTHKLKLLSEYFDSVLLERKTFELRKNDRNYQVGDILELCEWDGEKYTGRSVFCRITYIYYGNGEYGLQEGYCILGVKLEQVLGIQWDEIEVK